MRDWRCCCKLPRSLASSRLVFIILWVHASYLVAYDMNKSRYSVDARSLNNRLPPLKHVGRKLVQLQRNAAEHGTQPWCVSADGITNPD